MTDKLTIEDLGRLMAESFYDDAPIEVDVERFGIEQQAWDMIVAGHIANFATTVMAEGMLLACNVMFLAAFNLGWKVAHEQETRRVANDV